MRLNGSLVINNLSIYPNPFVSNIKLNINSRKEENITVRVIDMGGQLIIKRLINIQTGENIVVLKDLESLKNGTYLLEVISANNNLTQKIIKK